jgi:hypothetical protein
MSTQLLRRLPRNKTFWLQAAALLLAGLAAWPLMSQPGLLNTRGGGDSPFLLQRLQQLVTAVGDGHFPVRWMPDANYGYGYPFYNYYAPLSLYITAVFRFIGFSYVRAIQLAQLAGFLTAAWAMFHLGRRWLGSDEAGLVAAVAYTFAPFHMVNVYVRGDSLAEFWAMAFYPLVFLVVAPGSREDKETGGQREGEKGREWWVLLAVAVAGLILSHNISALIFMPFLLLYLGLIVWRSAGIRVNSCNSGLLSAGSLFTHYQLPITIFSSLLFALALATFFWLPALQEQSLAQLGPVTAGYFHFSNHFRGLDLVQPAFLFDYDVAGNPFRMGAVQAVTALLGLVVLLANGRVPLSTRLFIAAGLLVATVMITPLSRPLWQNLPLLPFTQFPWRFLSVQAFFGALAVGALAWLPGQRWFMPAVVAVLILAGMGGLRVDHLILTDADVTAVKLAEYEWFSGNIGSTVSAEYLPQTVQPRPYSSAWLHSGERDAVQIPGNGVEARLIERKSSRQQWQVRVEGETATLVMPTMHWPGWRATANGRPLAIAPAAGSGLITLELPQGSHTVQLYLARTPVRLVAEIISLGAFLLLLALLWPRLRPFVNRQTAIWATAVLIALLVLTTVVRLWPVRSLPPGTLTWDFAQMGYLHHTPAGIGFENGARLRGYSYSQEAGHSGRELVIVLDWATAVPLATTLSLTTPAANRFEQAPAIATVEQTIDSGTTSYRLAIPAQAPAGLYVPRLTVAGSRPVTTAGEKRGDLFLRPLRLAAGPTTAVAVPAENGLQVRVLDVQQRPWTISSAPGCTAVAAGGSILDVQMAWLTGQALTHNYNVSLRLTDRNGWEMAQCDSQPGYGFQPSAGWPAAEWVNDWLALPLPAALPAGEPYALTVRLYEVEKGTAVLTRRLGEFNQQGERLVFQHTQPEFDLPAGIEPLTATFAGAIGLRGYTVKQTDQALAITLYWQALSAGQADFSHFVHLLDPETDTVVAQHDAMPRQNSYPTSQWTAGEIVSDPLMLDLKRVPPGNYLLAVGLYYPIAPDFVRLTAVDQHGHPLPANRVILPTPVAVR